MSNRTRWHVIPKSRTASALWLLAGLLLLASTLWRLRGGDGMAVLPAIGIAAAVALIVIAVIGLVRPDLRGR